MIVIECGMMGSEFQSLGPHATTIAADKIRTERPDNPTTLWFRDGVGGGLLETVMDTTLPLDTARGRYIPTDSCPGKGHSVQDQPGAQRMR
jgi:hypothetical protein